MLFLVEWIFKLKERTPPPHHASTAQIECEWSQMALTSRILSSSVYPALHWPATFIDSTLLAPLCNNACRVWTLASLAISLWGGGGIKNCTHEDKCSAGLGSQLAKKIFRRILFCRQNPAQRGLSSNMWDRLIFELFDFEGSKGQSPPPSLPSSHPFPEIFGRFATIKSGTKPRDSTNKKSWELKQLYVDWGLVFNLISTITEKFNVTNQNFLPVVFLFAFRGEIKRFLSIFDD